MYCAVVLDVYSPRVVGWSIDASPTAALATNALGLAIESRRPPSGAVIHSDRAGCGPAPSGRQQPAQFLGLGGGRAVVAFTAVGLGLADPVPQGFVVHAQLLGQPPDHRLGVGLPVETHGAFTQLVGVLLRGCHGDSLHGPSAMIVDLRASGGTSAIMTGWMDRVLVPGVVYRLDAAAGEPAPLLKLRRLAVLNTGDTDPAREAETFGGPLDVIWRRCVGGYLSRAEIRRMLAEPISGSTTEQRARWLDHAARLVCGLPIS